MPRSSRPSALAAALAFGLVFPSIAQADEPAAAPIPAPTDKSDSIPGAPVTGKPTPTVAVPDPNAGHFEFGSYGRVRVAMDGRGGTGRQSNIVAHGSRIDEESYAELELRREDTYQLGAPGTPEIKSKVVATLALFPPFFHFSGNPMQQIAVRNLFAQGTYGAYTMWAGARMYRGDDIYLLDWWPLDNQNTVGGGFAYKFPDGDTTIAAHVGMQRLDNLYQYQQIPVVAPFGFGATNITKLDRPRIVETVKLTHLFRNFRGGKEGFKISLYGEAHELSAGTARDTVNNVDKPLPSDSGFLLGAQLGLWTGEHDSHVNLFLRHARGIAAYDPLTVPTTFANDRTTSGSTETLIALGANYEKEMVGILVGAYLRFFRDGDPSPTSTQKYDEGTVVVRPEVFIGDHWGVAFEGSFQARRFAILDPTSNSPLTASLLKGGVIPYFSPAGRGSFKRPQLRLIYSITARDAGARSLYPAEDVFAQRTVEHFIGLGAEWWFNSSSYP